MAIYKESDYKYSDDANPTRGFHDFRKIIVFTIDTKPEEIDGWYREENERLPPYKQWFEMIPVPGIHQGFWVKYGYDSGD